MKKKRYNLEKKKKNIYIYIYIYIYIQGVSKKRGPFLKFVYFLYLTWNLSKILYGCSKMILLGSGKDFIHNSTSTGSDVIMTPNCIYDIIFLFIHTVENTTDIK